jgi:hypothetical protein
VTPNASSGAIIAMPSRRACGTSLRSRRAIRTQQNAVRPTPAPTMAETGSESGRGDDGDGSSAGGNAEEAAAHANRRRILQTSIAVGQRRRVVDELHHLDDLAGAVGVSLIGRGSRNAARRAAGK